MRDLNEAALQQIIDGEQDAVDPAVVGEQEPDTTDAPEPAEAPDFAQYPAELVAEVTAAQLSLCTQTVPEALALRLAAAAALPAGQWRRNAGHNDPAVLALEGPHRRLATVVAEPNA